MIRGILFDMDGVLIDAREWHYEALNKSLNLFGYHINREDHLVTYDGLPTRNKLQMLSKEQGLPEGLRPFIDRMKQVYTMEMVHARCRPNFQHEYTLSRLKQEGMRLAICSNSIRATMEAMLNYACLKPYFECILSNEDVAKSKPDPEIYQKAMQKLGLSPKECLIVEDNENGVKAAKASGAHLLRVSGVGEVSYHHIQKAINKASSCRTETCMC